MKIRHASQVTTVTIVLFSLLAISCVMLARRSRIVAQKAYATRLQALAFTDRLSGGSDRLTGAVRAYAATGDRRYYEEFRQELTVDRNRDLSINGLRRLGITDDELALVTRAKKNSDRLVTLENRAFAAVERGDVPEAIRIVYGPEYATAKASIMEPIAEFRRRVEQRLTDNAAELAERARLLDDIALVILLLNALIIFVVLVLFYRRRVASRVRPRNCTLATSKVQFRGLTPPARPYAVPPGARSVALSAARSGLLARGPFESAIPTSSSAW